jgi:thiol-disulfide isomerase/thioredoxin
MNFKTRIVGMLLVGAVALSACAAPAPTAMPDKAMAKPTPTTEAMKKELPTAETAMAKPTDSQMMEKTAATPDAMKKELPTAEAAMAKPTDSQMMEKTAATPDAMKKELPTAEAAMAKPTAGAAMPAWFAAQLTDVTTGKTFMLGDLKGKVVLVETMAIWCPTCLRQQGEVQALHKALSDRADLVSVTLDIDPNEKAEALKAYVAKNSFRDLYAVAPADVAREIGRQLGDQFLNPPSAPMFVIDRRGQVHPLPFGVKNAQALADALRPFLDEKM